MKKLQKTFLVIGILSLLGCSNSAKKLIRQTEKTLSVLEKENPANPNLKMISGVFYELEVKDTLKARNKFIEARTIYISILDTISNENVNKKDFLMNKAISDIFLRDEIVGRKIIQELYENEIREDLKEMFYYYLNRSREELLFDSHR